MTNPLHLLYLEFLGFLFSMQPIALRLVCHGVAARSESALHPHGFRPLIQHLTQSASLHTRGLNFLADGQHHAVYVARGACRDVYRIGESIVLKLCTHENESRLETNQREVAAFQATQHLPQTPVFFLLRRLRHCHRQHYAYGMLPACIIRRMVTRPIDAHAFCFTI